MSVHQFRTHGRTNSTDNGSNYLDTKLPPGNGKRLKRIFLQGASNRVKSLNEELQFMQLNSERYSNEKMFKFKRPDQLVQLRQLHLNHKLEPIKDQPQSIQQQTSSQLEFSLDQNEDMIQMVYKSIPIVKKHESTLVAAQLSSFKQIPSTKNLTHNSTTSYFNLPKQKTESVLQHSMHTTTYGALKFKTSASSKSTCTSPHQKTLPYSLNGTKRYLQKFI